MYITERIPRRMAVFLICCLVPQWITTNNIVATILKIGILLYFVSRLSSGNTFRFINSFVTGYGIIYIVNVLYATMVYGGSLMATTQSIVITFITLILFYQIPKINGNIAEWEVLDFYKVFSIFILVSCAFNMVNNYNAIFRITSLSIYAQSEVKSFFDNKNTFGFFLMFGVISNVILAIKTKEKKWWLLTGIFFLNELMSMCRTAIIISFVTVALSFFADKKQRLRNILLFSFFAMVLIYLVSHSATLSSFLIDKIGNTESVGDRNKLIEALLPQMTGSVIITGYGPSEAVDLAIRYTGMQYYHNTYLKLFVEGGLIRILLFITLMLASFSSCLKISRFDTAICNASVLSLGAYLIYGYVESLPLFESSVASMTATIFVVSMPLFWLRAYENEYEGEETL